MLNDVIWVLKRIHLLHLEEKKIFNSKIKKRTRSLPESSFVGKSFNIVVVSNKDFSCNSPFFNSHTAAIGAFISEFHTGLPYLSNAITTPVCN